MDRRVLAPVLLLVAASVPPAVTAITPLVDFELVSITPQPTGVHYDGDIVRFVVVVRNSGGTPAAPPPVDLTVEGASKGQQSSPEFVPIDDEVAFTWSWRAVAGDQITIGARLMPASADADTNGLNNEKSIDINVKPPPQPDLRVDSITLDPPSPVEGDRVTIYAVVSNLDREAVDPAPATTSALVVNGVARGTAATPALLHGGAATVSFSWTATPGPVTLGVAADRMLAVLEDDETNNLLESSLTIPEAPDAPDLVVEAVEIAPGPYAVGDSVGVDVRVKNVGVGAAPAFVVHFGSADPASVTSLGVGATKSLAWSWTVEGGPQSLTVTIDPPLEIAEANTGNNELTLALDLRPDLALTDFVTSPAAPREGDLVTLTANVRNLGALRSDATVASLLVNGQRSGAPLNLGAVSVGTTEPVEFTWVATTGATTLELLVETGMALAELHDANNLLGTTLRILPDLHVESVEFLPDNPSEKDPVRVEVTVRNVGVAPAPASTARLEIDGEAWTPHDLPLLGTGDAAVVAWTWAGGAAGSHVVVAKADPVAGEIISTDNSLARTLVVKAPGSAPAPNLRADAISWSPASPKVGEKVTITLRVRNVGDASAPASTARMTLDGSSLGDRSVPVIPAAKDALVTWTWTADLEGDAGLVATADALGVVDEGAAEADNDLERAMPVAAAKAGSSTKPNLIVDALMATPAKPAPGSSVVITARVKNAGGALAAASVADLRVKGVSLGTRNVPAIPAGSTAEVKWTWTATSGVQTARAEADAEGAVAESDETDNVRTQTVESASTAKATTKSSSPTAPLASRAGAEDEDPDGALPEDEPLAEEDAATGADASGAADGATGSTADVRAFEMPTVPRKWVVGGIALMALGLAFLLASARRRV